MKVAQASRLCESPKNRGDCAAAALLSGALRRCFVFVALLAVLLGPLALSSAARAGGTLLCLLDCQLTQDETYDLVIISAGATLETNGHTLTIESGGLLTCLGTLVVEDGGTLTLDGGSLSAAGTLSIEDGGTVVIEGGSHHSLSGAIHLRGPGSLLRITANTTLGGLPLDLLGGRIVGEHPDARIQIDQGAVLTSRVDIEGTLTISGPGILRNEDSVVADVEGQTLLLASDLNLSDIENALWKAFKGTLRFAHAQVGNARLLGDVHLHGTIGHGGTLDFDASVTFDNGVNCDCCETGSVFKWVVGTLSIASGCTFTYRCYSFDFATFCRNPDMDTCANQDIDPPLETCGPYDVYCP